MAKRRSSGNGTTPPARGEPRPGCYFRSLTLQNVRCFGDEPQTLRFEDEQGRLARWTILLGENGTGKSTVLQALLGFERTRDMPEGNALEMKSMFRALDWLFEDKLGWLIRGRGVRSTITAGLAVGAVLDREVVEKTSKNIDLDIQIWSSDTGGLSLKPSLPKEFVDWHPACFAYGADRNLRFDDAGAGGDDGINDVLGPTTRLRDAEQWLVNLDYSVLRSPKREGQQARLEETKQFLVGVLPDVSDMRLTSTTGPNPKPVLEFQTPFGWVPMKQLGYGYRTAIAWVVDLISRLVERYPDSKDPLAEPAVVLVDEIDLHLHPKWQRTIISYLTERFPNTQFIVTAHSPLIVQAAAGVEANLALLKREGDRVVIDNDVDRIRNWRIDQILTSELFGLDSARPPQLDEKLEERRAILSKPKLSKGDKESLARLEREIGPMPVGETFDEAKRMTELIEENRRLLKKYLEPEA